MRFDADVVNSTSAINIVCQLTIQQQSPTMLLTLLPVQRLGGIDHSGLSATLKFPLQSAFSDYPSTNNTTCSPNNREQHGLTTIHVTNSPYHQPNLPGLHIATFNVSTTNVLL